MSGMGLAGKRAFVTGAGGGIGLAVVRLLVREGVHVIATDHDEAALAPVAGLGPDAVTPRVLDVRSSAAVEEVVAAEERAGGPIDLGVNVAGVLATALALETTDEVWRTIFAVNTDGVFHVLRALGRRMKARRRGSLVTVSSNAAGIPRHGMAAYGASKAAASMFTRSLGLELAPFGVRCNIVAPGSTLTPMLRGMWQDESGAERTVAGTPEAFRTGIPLGKLGTPEDVAEAVVFLLSDRAGQITMADLYVDGGAAQKV